jgi:hypothetical protein
MIFLQNGGEKMCDLTDDEKLKLNTIQKIVTGEYAKKRACEILGITTRQVNRLLIKFKEEGENGFVHKNRGKISNRGISENIKNEIVNLYITEYFDYNFTHFYEEIWGKYRLSYKTIDNILTEADIISPEAKHKTIKLYNSNMKKAIRKKEINSEQLKLYKIRQEEQQKKHIRRSVSLYNFGQEVQMDAAFAIWYGNKTMALHLAVDKATKKVLYGWFDVQETTRGYYIMLMNIITIYGIPQKIKTDKRGTFSINNVKMQSKLNTTQFGRICKELEIDLRSSSDPLFKPNVERENKTFKGRLIAELRHENIVEDKEANEYLNKVFIPKMNELFSYDISPDKNDMIENTYSSNELNIIVSERYTRKVDNASAIKYKGDYYVPVDIETGEIMSYCRNTLCTIIIAYDYSYWGCIEEKIFKLSKINTPVKKTYQKTTKTIEEINRSKAHKPAQNHPWRWYKKN